MQERLRNTSLVQKVEFERPPKRICVRERKELRDAPCLDRLDQDGCKSALNRSKHAFGIRKRFPLALKKPQSVVRECTGYQGCDEKGRLPRFIYHFIAWGQLPIPLGK